MVQHAGGINAVSGHTKPGKPGLQGNEISLFSIYPDFIGVTCIGVQPFCRIFVMSCPRSVVLSYIRTLVLYGLTPTQLFLWVLGLNRKLRG